MRYKYVNMESGVEDTRELIVNFVWDDTSVWHTRHSIYIGTSRRGKGLHWNFNPSAIKMSRNTMISMMPIEDLLKASLTGNQVARILAARKMESNEKCALF